MSEILNQDQTLNYILEIINSKKSASFIRKGDGENIVLSYGSLKSIPFHKYRKKLVHFNIPIWDIPFQLFIRSELIIAFSNATLLGISPINHRHGLWEMEEKILNYYYFQDILRCDMNFHMGFIKIPNKNKLINPIAEEIINNQKIGIISHCEVENFLNHYNSQVIIRIEIPKRRANFQRMTRKKYDVVLSEIKKYCSLVDIWLVAAGIYAKPFCEHIRKNGGIGIDIGSSLDTWVDEYHSRGHLRELLKQHDEKNCLFE